MKLELSGLRLARPDFSLEVDLALEGNVLGLFGPSGSGKTTLLNLIAGLTPPDAGRIALDGIALTDGATRLHRPPRARGIGYVPQDLALFPHVSVRDNLLYGAGETPRHGSGVTLDTVVDVLEMVPLLTRRVPDLSGGEKQRVALGRALMARPKLLLLDEPLTGLDRALRERALDLLARIDREFHIPMIVVSHVPEEMVRLDPWLVVLENGRVTRTGAARRLFEETLEPRLRLRPTP